MQGTIDIGTKCRTFLENKKHAGIVFYKENVPETLDYTRISVFLTKIVQEQQTKIDDLTSKLQVQQSQIDDLTSKLQALTDLVNSKLV